MKRRTFLQSSIAGVGGLTGMRRGISAPARALGGADPGAEDPSGERIGRRVRITSISFPNGVPLEEIAQHVDAAGAAGVDVIALPEACVGQNASSEEGLDNPTVTAMAALARKHQTYIACPIDRRFQNQRLNTAVFLDRTGKVVCTYDKVFPYWSEFDLHPAADVGDEAQVYEADFGKVGFAICFDVNFPEVWKRLADRGAEIVIWPSAYSAGRSLQAHAINHHYYVVTATQKSDCLVYDITGEQVAYSKSDHINVATHTLDLDRAIFHENFNIAGRDKLLKEHAADIEQEKWLELEQWFVLKAKRPGVSARELARQYGLEELRHYLDRSRRGIDERRGWQYQAKVLFPELDTAHLKTLSSRVKGAGPSGTAG